MLSNKHCGFCYPTHSFLLSLRGTGWIYYWGECPRTRERPFPSCVSAWLVPALQTASWSHHTWTRITDKLTLQVNTIPLTHTTKLHPTDDQPVTNHSNTYEKESASFWFTRTCSEVGKRVPFHRISFESVSKSVITSGLPWRRTVGKLDGLKFL